MPYTQLLPSIKQIVSIQATLVAMQTDNPRFQYLSQVIDFKDNSLAMFGHLYQIDLFLHRY